MKIITNSRIFLFLPQQEPIICTRPHFTALDVPFESVLNKFENAMRQLQREEKLWSVDYICIDYATFELALMQKTLTTDHIINAVETADYIKIKYRFEDIGGCWELRVLDNAKLQGIWGDGRLLVPIY
jgi:hypothetical protein